MRPAVLLSLILIAACVAADAQVVEPQNLAPNPSFEHGDRYGPSSWETRPAPGSISEFEWVEGIARTGRRSLLIHSEEEYSISDRWRGGYDRSINLQPGTEATLSAWVKTQDATGQAHLQLYIIGPVPRGEREGEILCQQTGGSVSGTSDWTRRSLTVTVPERSCYVMPYVGLRGAGMAWFDDVELIGTPATPMPAETTYEPRHFEELEGYEMVMRSNRYVLQAPPGLAHATASVPFYDATARWDVTFRYLDEPDGASTFRVLVNGNEIGSVVADAVEGGPNDPDEVREVTFADVDIQQYSTITIVGEQNEGEYARIVALQFRPVGTFQGEELSPERLSPPPNLRIYQSPFQRNEASLMLIRQYWQREGQDFAAVSREIEKLQTPEELRAYQERVRARLPEIFGRWTGESGSPLNPQKVGAIELDYCTIEKIIIESEPGLYVPIHVYIPKNKPLPAPGVCVTMGHSAAGKQYRLYHEFGLGLAEKGYVVVALDPLGQGERTYWNEPPEELGAKGGPVGQHHYELRRGFLVGRSLSGLRTRDGVRAVDYMLTRDDIIDPERIGVAGNSGGGQMAMLIAACHEAVKVCCAAHPGGSCENMYFRGGREWDRMVMSLIPPRPLIWIVGDQSGESHHQGRFTWLQPLYEVFGATDAHKHEWVEGVHNMERPKREAAYEWLNRWFGINAGREEGEIVALEEQELWCTDTGLAETSIGGIMPWDLDARLMREMTPERPAPPADGAQAQQFLAERRQSVLAKLGIDADAERLVPPAREVGAWEGEGLRARKLVVEAERGITIAALVIEPVGRASGDTIIHVAASGKPQQYDPELLPFRLAQAGRRVVSVDVRGRGEYDAEGGAVGRVVEYDRTQWARRDTVAISCADAGRPIMGARAMDLVTLMDYLDAESGQRGRYELIGEELGGAWVLMASVADERVSSVTTIGTLSCWARLIETKWNALRDYFWVPRALETFDLSDLPALAHDARVSIINPADPMLHPLEASAAAEDFDWARQWCGDRLRIECGVGESEMPDLLKE